MSNKSAPSNLAKLAKINWQGIARNLPVYFGLSGGERKKSTEHMVRELANEETGYAYPLTDYLSYRYFDADKELFFNDGNFMGFMMEIAPIVGVDEGMLKNLHFFFNNDKELPEGSFMQFLLIADHNVEGLLDKWRELRTNKHPVIQKLTKKRADFIRKLSVNFAGRDGRIARDYRIYVSFSQRMELSGGSIEKMQNFKKLLADKLSVLGLHYRVCRAEDLIEVCRSLVQMEIPASTEKISYDPAVLLSDQLLKPLRPIMVRTNEIRHERSGLVSKSFYTKKLPREFSLHQMIGLLGSSNNNALGIGARFVISYTIAADFSEGRQKAINISGQRVIDEAEKWYSRNNRDIAREAAEWREAIDSNKNNERYLNEAFSVMITVPSEQMPQAEQSLMALYNTLDFQLEVNQNLQLVAMLAILPMQQGIFWQALKRFKLTGTCLAEAAVARLPIHAEWKGAPMSGVLLQSRRGQIFNWNPFYQILGGNYNVCVFGPSGVGKSVLMEELVSTIQAQNGRVFIIDIGKSYKNLCHSMGGEFIQFVPGSDISLNPLSKLALSGAISTAKPNESAAGKEKIETMWIGEYLVNLDAISYAKNVLASMCGVNNAAYETALLEKAIVNAIEKHGTDLNITHIADLLGTSCNPDDQRLGRTLFTYTARGGLGRYFDRESNITFKKQLTVFELEEIKNNENLLSVLLQVVGMEILGQILCGDRIEKFMLVVDEGWRIIDSAAGFLEALARTLRKYNGSLVTCVQSMSDFQKSEQSKKIFSNSTWKIIMKQEENEVGSFIKEEGFKDMMELIKSISINFPRYAEILLYTTGIKVIGRLVLDPYSNALYSTKPADYTFLQSAMASGLSLEGAIEELAIEKYGAEK